MTLHLKQTLIFEALFSDYVSAQEINDWLTKIDQAIAQGRAFFFIAHTQPHTRFAADYRSVQALWYKAHREAFARHCLGLVRIAADEAEHARLDSPTLHAAWGVPYFVARERQQAFDWLQQRMVHA